MSHLINETLLIFFFNNITHHILLRNISHQLTIFLSGINFNVNFPAQLDLISHEIEDKPYLS